MVIDSKNTAKAESAIQDEVVNEVLPSGGDFLLWLSVGIFGTVVLFLSMTAGQMFDRGIRPGDFAERDIVAPRAAKVIDPVATSKAIESARHLVIPVFQEDRSKDMNALVSVSKSLAMIRRLQSRGLKPIAELPGLSDEEHFYLLTTSEASFQSMLAGGPELSGIEKRISGKLTKPAGAPTGKRLSRRRLRALENRQRQELEQARQTLARQREVVSDVLDLSQEVAADRLRVALAISPDRLSDYSSDVRAVTRRICQRFKRFPVSDKMKAWSGTVYEYLPDNWDKSVRASFSEIITRALEPNLVIDPAATKHKADAAIREVKPITTDYQAGQVIVEQGTRVSEEIAQTLQAMGVTRINSLPMLLMLGLTLVAAVICSALFLHHYEPRHFFSPASIGLMFTLIIVASATASIIGRSYPQFAPIPGAALALTIFFGRRVALVLIIPLLFLIAVDRLITGSHILALSVASVAAVLAYSRDRRSLMFTGLIICLAQAGGFLIAYGISKFLPFLSLGATPWMVLAPHVSLPPLSNLGQALGLEFAGGLLSAIVAIGCLPFLESIFGLVTPDRLAELAEADQPLLRQLEEKAPGTYQHSLAVANLAEAGAKAIKADVKLVRAGALYHDIGKMAKPKFFIENQLGAKNPHDAMSPEDSRDRVLAHVTDGIELAKKNGLPKAIRDFIPTHQGTTLMAYFYHKACERDGPDNVDQRFYRYPGPKPHSKETAIVMLADVAEAVTHSMRDPTEKEVEEAIGRVFDARWMDGQFSDTGLTFDELERIKLAFVRVWRTLHHERLKYPSTNTGKMDITPETVGKDDTKENAVAESENDQKIEEPPAEEAEDEEQVRGESCS